LLDLFSLFGIGFAAFIASNIDDTFIMILLLSSSNFRARYVFSGQFLGIGVLIIISAFGSLIALVLPSIFISLLGLIPIGIGIKRLMEYRSTDKIPKQSKNVEGNKRRGFLPLLTVSAITTSNGGDDIGVFTPLFAKYNTFIEVTILVTMLLGLTLLWCILTYYFFNHRRIAARTHQYGNIITPFVLIAIGLFILTDTSLF
jgi:cadmium resistance protein CadD (predicted permease)